MPLSELPPRARRLKQKRNRAYFKAYYERKKQKAQRNTNQASQAIESSDIERVSPPILAQCDSPLSNIQQSCHEDSPRSLSYKACKCDS